MELPDRRRKPAPERDKSILIQYPSGTNRKLRGLLRIVDDPILGKRWVCGRELLGVYDIPVTNKPGQVQREHIYKDIRVEVTGATVTIRG